MLLGSLDWLKSCSSPRSVETRVPEFLRSDHCRGSECWGASGWQRILHCQLFYSAACLQTKLSGFVAWTLWSVAHIYCLTAGDYRLHVGCAPHVEGEEGADEPSQTRLRGSGKHPVPANGGLPWVDRDRAADRAETAEADEGKAMSQTMPDFEEGRTEPPVKDNRWPDTLVTRIEVFANTPAASLLLQRLAWQRVPGGAPSYDSNGRAYLLLDADDLDELKHSATAERLTWQAAPKAKPKE